MSLRSALEIRLIGQTAFKILSNVFQVDDIMGCTWSVYSHQGKIATEQP